MRICVLSTAFAATELTCSYGVANVGDGTVRVHAGKLKFLLWFGLICRMSLASDGQIDPYDFREARFPGGPRKGQLIEVSKTRPTFILKGEEAARYGPNPGDLVFANFYHDRRFWIAKIAPDAIDEVIYQNEYYAALVPHVQLRFKLIKGKEIELFPQVGKGPSIKLNDVTISSEGSQERGVPLNLVNLLSKPFASAIRVESTEEAYLQSIQVLGDKIVQYRLSLTEEQKQKVFAAGVHRSARVGFNEMFSLLNRNCTTECYDLLTDALPRNWAANMDGIGRRIGTVAWFSLWMRGYLDPKTARMPLLNDDWPNRADKGPVRQNPDYGTVQSCSWIFRAMNYVRGKLIF